MLILSLVLIIVQVFLTAVVFVAMHRRLVFETIALRHQLGVYVRTVDKAKVRAAIRDRDRILRF